MSLAAAFLAGNRYGDYSRASPPRAPRSRDSRGSRTRARASVAREARISDRSPCDR